MHNEGYAYKVGFLKLTLLHKCYTHFQATTSCSEVVGYCSWNGAMQEDCSVLFQATLTEGGVSCMFNKVPPSLLRVYDFVSIFL